ncbi:MAG: hypothetical protein ACOZAN_00885 [Patescibacteria group bacterium]
MQRGVIQFTTQEIQATISQIDTADNIDTAGNQTAQFLLQKLQSSLKMENSAESSNLSLVQMSEEEVEWLIDQLPPPIPSTSEVLQELRKKLADFLTKLRNPQR